MFTIFNIIIVVDCLIVLVGGIIQFNIKKPHMKYTCVVNK